MVEQRDDLVVQVGVDEHLHKLLLEALLQVAHHGRERGLVLAERAAAEAGAQGELELGGRAEAVPGSSL